jgi:hypothetical protein
MKHTFIAAIALALFAVNVASSDEDLADQIKALQTERGEVLTKLVSIRTVQYKAGVVSGEIAVRAETDLLNAKLDAAVSREATIDILFAALQRERDSTKVATDRHRIDLSLWRSILSQNSTRLDRLLKKDIKGDQETHIRNLTELVAKYKERYLAGTASLEALVKAKAALLDATMDAAETQEKRAAVLEEAVKSDAEVLKVVEAKCKASAATARSHLLDAKIRQLRQRGSKEQLAAQIKALQKEQVEALTEVMNIDTELEGTGWVMLATLTPQAHADLVNAQIDAADTSEAKVLLLTKAVETQTRYVRTAEATWRAGSTGEAEFERERSRLLDLKIRLLQERASQKARDK